MAYVDRSDDFCQLDDAETAELLLRDDLERCDAIERHQIRKAKMYEFRWQAGMP